MRRMGQPYTMVVVREGPRPSGKSHMVYGLPPLLPLHDSCVQPDARPKNVSGEHPQLRIVEEGLVCCRECN